MSNKKKKADKQDSVSKSFKLSRLIRGRQDGDSVEETCTKVLKPEKGAASARNTRGQSPNEHGRPTDKTSWADEHIWNLPGLSRFDFYAASEYLRQCEKNQGPSAIANNAPSPANIRKGLEASPVQQRDSRLFGSTFRTSQAHEKLAKTVQQFGPAASACDRYSSEADQDELGDLDCKEQWSSRR